MVKWRGPPASRKQAAPTPQRTLAGGAMEAGGREAQAAEQGERAKAGAGARVVAPAARARAGSEERVAAPGARARAGGEAQAEVDCRHAGWRSHGAAISMPFEQPCSLCRRSVYSQLCCGAEKLKGQLTGSNSMDAGLGE